MSIDAAEAAGSASLRSLIERLGSAPRGDDELDAAVIAAVFGGTAKRSEITGNWYVTMGQSPRGNEYMWEPKTDSDSRLRRMWLEGWGPTRCIDAAVPLLPKGWQWSVSNRAPAPHTGRAYIRNRELINTGVGGMTPNPKYRGHETTAATPALALCIVALEALADARSAANAVSA